MNVPSSALTVEGFQEAFRWVTQSTLAQKKYVKHEDLCQDIAKEQAKDREGGGAVTGPKGKK